MRPSSAQVSSKGSHTKTPKEKILKMWTTKQGQGGGGGTWTLVVRPLKNTFLLLSYNPFHNSLPKSSPGVYWISVGII